jgi:hypothetical protein
MLGVLATGCCMVARDGWTWAGLLRAVVVGTVIRVLVMGGVAGGLDL